MLIIYETVILILIWCICFRYYRPLENRAATSGDEVLMLDDDEQGYTENYTIV